MTRHDTELQEQKHGITAYTATKHGTALWRGQVIHPGFGTVSDEGVPTGTPMEDIVSSGDPITDAKGLNIRLSWRAPRGIAPHFFVSDRDYQLKLSAAYPAFHHAAVRVLADYLRANGYDGLRKLVWKTLLPPNPFVVGAVQTERTFRVEGVAYRPDIVVENSAPGFPRIELEVVNRHGPSRERLAAARKAGALVLWMNIRDTIEDCLLDGRSGDLVPSDDALLRMLLPLWFTRPADSREIARKEFIGRWLDREQVPYIDGLRKDVVRVHRDVQRTTRDLESAARTPLDALAEKGVQGAMQTLLPGLFVGRRDPRPAEVDDWAVGLVGMRYKKDDILSLPDSLHEAEKVLEVYRKASSIPPGIQAALNKLKRAKADLLRAVDALLDAAEACREQAVAVRKRAHEESERRERAEREARRAYEAEVAAARYAEDAKKAEREKALQRACAEGEKLVAAANTFLQPILSEFEFLCQNIMPPLRIRRRGPGAGEIVLPTKMPRVLPEAVFMARLDALRTAVSDDALQQAVGMLGSWRSTLAARNDHELKGWRAAEALVRKTRDLRAPSSQELDELESLYKERLEAYAAHE